MTEIRLYTDDAGQCPFENQIAAFPAPVAVEFTIAVEKIAGGLRGNIKSVGHGVSEYKIHRHGGLRLYFGWDRGGGYYPDGGPEKTPISRHHAGPGLVGRLSEKNRHNRHR